MKNPSILPGKELDICYENIQLKLLPFYKSIFHQKTILELGNFISICNNITTCTLNYIHNISYFYILYIYTFTILCMLLIYNIIIFNR